MPKYCRDKIAGYYLYYTKHCIIEAMHAHASDSKLTETGSAKFWVKADGSSEVQDRGNLNDHEINVIQKYIKKNYMQMYDRWSQDSENGFFGEIN